jgi:hypothetical protein
MGQLQPPSSETVTPVTMYMRLPVDRAAELELLSINAGDAFHIEPVAWPGEEFAIGFGGANRPDSTGQVRLQPGYRSERLALIRQGEVGCEISYASELGRLTLYNFSVEQMHAADLAERSLRYRRFGTTATLQFLKHLHPPVVWRASTSNRRSGAA